MPVSAEELSEMIRDRMVGRGQPLVQAAESFRSMFGSDVVDTAEQLIRSGIGEVEDLRDPTVVSRQRFVPWYPGPRDDDRFWPKFKKYLLEDKKWGEETVDVIDKASTKVVSRLPMPADEEFDGRGLVLGYVQSGKTANFTAVAAKAADQGYRLIIVLSGLTNVLRQQTQERMVSDLVEHDPESWMEWTKADADIGDIAIRPGTLLAQKTVRHIAVVKKNGPRLRRLRNMLKAAGPQILKTCPVLIIDDECDQASLNSARLDHQRTAINRLLLEILEVLPKVAYVGYTATPFANVLVDPNEDTDLYPRDFILNLPKPDQYFGAERLFGRHLIEGDSTDDGVDDGLDMIRLVPEAEEAELRPGSREEKDTWKIPITKTLGESLKYFAMAATAREIRKGEPVATSMLIHTTFYAQPMINSQPVISEYLKSLEGRIRSGDTELLSSLRDQWEEESSCVPAELFGCTPVSADEIVEKLPDVLRRTKIFIENGVSERRIEEYEGPFIAIGGNILARGLTLEGLICSLFVRTTSMYDSLMQMGRWFGYRRGYEDLPRIWMPKEMASYFRDLATVEHEIRQDIARYSEDGEISPKDVGVRIRLHPRLQVTSRLKQRSGRIVGSSSYAGHVLQTIRFATGDRDWLSGNLEAGASILQRCHQAIGDPIDMPNCGSLYRDLEWEWINEFLNQYLIHDTHADFNTQTLRDYVTHQQQYGHLMQWNLGVARSNSSVAATRDEFGPLSGIRMFNRSARYSISEDAKNIGVLLAKQHATIDFRKGYEGARDNWKDIKRERSTVVNRTPPPAASNPLLLFYLVDRNSVPMVSAAGKLSRSNGQSNRHGLEAVEDVLGIGILFPETDNPDPVQYIVADLPESDVEDEFDPEDFAIEEMEDA